MSSLGELRTIAREARRKKDSSLPKWSLKQRFPDNRAGYLFLLPWLVGLLVFTIGPMIASGYLGFAEYNLLQPPQWSGLGDWGTSFNDARRCDRLRRLILG